MFPILTRRAGIRHSQLRAQLSILCRGKSIVREELFAYTNGHFLVDEQRQLGRRYVKFDVDALCHVAAAVGGDSSPITSIEKMEGGFSKALLMKKENGIEVIAKIPCHIAGPASLTTACEVGVLEYVRKHTGIPVPRVLSWSSDSSDPVGAEYIIMEKAAGVPLFQKWPSMAEFDKLELIKNLTKLEAQLSAIRFPAYGGLYLRADARDPKYHYEMLDSSIDASHTFCIGPSCDRSFDVDPATNPTQPNMDSYQGPWTTISQLGISIAKREVSRIPPKQSDRPPMFYHGSVEEQIQLLESTISLMPMLDSLPELLQTSQPTLWHTDLHMGNIYVAPDDSTRIVSIIDFQSVSVMPAFLQARWPEFLKPPQDYTEGLVHPQLPDGFEDMDEENKILARREWSQAKMAKAYEISTYLEDRPAHNARHVRRVFRELFTRCGEVSEVGIIPLRACLIEIFQNWSSLGFTGTCPFTFTAEDIATHEAQIPEYQAWHEAQRLAQDCLDTDAEGWVAPQLDFAEKRRQNRELLAMFIERMAGVKSPEEARKMWPFPDEADLLDRKVTSESNGYISLDQD
ncbi:uncharacterized protein BO80DRAFT_422605 [Aspergillus ibericus CBS 121593]|uniref:Altered inheritance of mitochondria protein 9, mitochondrial n=1 Tax=Aspergillus ibericus CBS 121593 TaxID=1448316 RepID=A0A395H9K7_9EURO|nr:phosphotransferase enzyme family protein [Aspergillus ibericus CBS 121593]RAL04249.1 phosphotransferase enzyme family protein [Aspergillus ibericus CBS 121593]